MKRVVITGMGVVAPNGVGLKNFERAVKDGKSGIRKLSELEDLNFRCTIGGIPLIEEELITSFIKKNASKKIKSTGVIYACLAALEAWEHAGLERIEDKKLAPYNNYGCVFGAGQPGVEVLRDAFNLIDDNKVKFLGSTSLPQSMSSAPSAFVAGMIGLGNWVTTVSSACCSGTDAVISGWRHIQNGHAKVMLCGSTDSSGPYIWGGFDSMRVMNSRSNDHPERASMPMSKNARGFVPGSGSGAVVLEELESAKERNATIYGEIIGGFQNSGGQREKGSMTAPSVNGIIRCIEGALLSAKVSGDQIDLVCGHLTSTMGDILEIEGWSKGLKISKDKFPYINSLKSMTGHCISAAGAIEIVAALLQLNGNYVHPNINLEEIHPEILHYIDEKKIPRQIERNAHLNYIAKANFGFGDVNTCIILKKFKQNE